jgi:hypothetical protein
MATTSLAERGGRVVSALLNDEKTMLAISAAAAGKRILIPLLLASSAMLHNPPNVVDKRER